MTIENLFLRIFTTEDTEKEKSISLRGYFLPVVLYFFLPVFLLAQNEDARFNQFLTWTGDEYARRYEVVIEKEEGEGTYIELRRESTSGLFIELSLSSGKYRCQVIPHNILNQPGEASEWVYMEVIAARNPELDILSGFFLSETKSGTALYEMRVSGKNLMPGAEIFLHDGDGERITPVEIQTDEDVTYVRLFFEKGQLTAGDYELIVINPGGLMASRSGIPFPPPQRVQPKQVHLVDIFLSAAWMPSFTVSDRGNRFFGEAPSLAGVAGRFGVAWVKPQYFNPGAELAVSYNAFGTGAEAEHLLAFTFNLSALKWLPGDRTALTFRLGAGYSVFLPDNSPSVDGGTAYANIGVSFLLLVMKHLYLETGLDYAHSLPAPSSSCFRPWIGIGFNK
jgi:hypothetical protein